MSSKKVEMHKYQIEKMKYIQPLQQNDIQNGSDAQIKMKMKNKHGDILNSTKLSIEHQFSTSTATLLSKAFKFKIFKKLLKYFTR
jgi:hypothetical protein